MTPELRPWYGSSHKGEFRLHTTDTDHDEHRLFQSCCQRADKPPITQFRELEYLDSGWEYSVFRNESHVIKIPSRRFAEVSNPRYLANAEINYQKILTHVGERFVAETQFNSEFIQQERIDARHVDTVELRNVDQPTRSELVPMFSGLLTMLRQEDWLPDLDIEPKHGVVKLKNWLLDRNGVPKIIDFTTYYDVFRLNQRRLNSERPQRERRLVEALKLLS
jgi:hypothetical protein